MLLGEASGLPGRQGIKKTDDGGGSEVRLVAEAKIFTEIEINVACVKYRAEGV